ncbi:hypothetical protein [Jannaschia rubra]|uniref:Uncharacterized protein n=1 Tax=Jannaschia rubra TaxID=282197 RepID=A0A0M6XRE5_9RHOB|nr:hypothetical protein [Jannaschia rubra]CTQ32604.1 hypothetical protein JAN5088_01375 [Jannaschia rubra]SFF85862.1 hypothetical protein SAMN04488517_101538 [Jannaschia rubra]
MTAWTLNRITVASGVYRGLLTGEGEPPALEMAMGDEVLGNLTASAAEGGWQVEGEMGPAPLTDGTWTVAIRTPEGDMLDSVTIVTGLGAPEDMRAELDALRAEVGILKTAFRRHVNGD